MFCFRFMIIIAHFNCYYIDIECQPQSTNIIDYMERILLIENEENLKLKRTNKSINSFVQKNISEHI